MSPAIRLQTNYLLQIFFLGMLILMLSAAGGLSIVWMRQQISRSAASIMAKENELAGIERKISYLDSKIATLHRPEALKARAKYVNLGLISPGERQIVYLIPRSNGAPVWSNTSEPYMDSIELALLDTPPNLRE